MDSGGRPVRTSDLQGKPFVLFFYPKAGSWGCTGEAVAFSARHDEFAARGIRLFGISVDTADDQQAFVAKCRLPYPLVVDRTATIARAFGVLGAFGLPRRVTFLIGADGRILHVTDSLLPGAHPDEVLRSFDGPTGNRTERGGGASEAPGALRKRFSSDPDALKR
ncbi:MAG: peroxiredoxin [Thermoplasmata archaeon]|nr:peroxiredoxin [Thermoplasmata archaeon]